MALQITKDKEEFRIEGKLRASNAENFYSHFKHVLGLDKSLTINIEAVSEIDRSGVKALTSLHGLAKEIDSKLLIVGSGSRDIHEEIKTYQ